MFFSWLGSTCGEEGNAEDDGDRGHYLQRRSGPGMRQLVAGRALRCQQVACEAGAGDDFIRACAGNDIPGQPSQQGGRHPAVAISFCLGAAGDGLEGAHDSSLSSNGSLAAMRVGAPRLLHK